MTSVDLRVWGLLVVRFSSGQRPGFELARIAARLRVGSVFTGGG